MVSSHKKSLSLIYCMFRASRNRHALLASQALGIGNGVGCLGTITLQVRVPYRVVGLVVGPKGATIKRIQQQTHTYIVTPSREKEPVFEVTGRFQKLKPFFLNFYRDNISLIKIKVSLVLVYTN